MTKELIAEVDAMDHTELARLWRFAPGGDPRMQGEVGQRVKHRLFTELGGFTPEISKAIGWGGPQ
jgi:hypothetical protein